MDLRRLQVASFHYGIRECLKLTTSNTVASNNIRVGLHLISLEQFRPLSLQSFNYNVNNNHDHKKKTDLFKAKATTASGPATMISIKNIYTNEVHHQHPMSSLTFQSQSFYFSTKSKSKKSKPSSCPFQTLSIPKDSTYNHAKKSFLQIAMKNHPDTIHQHLSKDDDDYDVKMKDSIELFRRARIAFEALVEGSEGECLLKVNVELLQKEKENEMMTNEQFDAWFLHETGHSNPYNFDLDPQTMREVAEAAETMGGGAERDGGMWGLARMIGNTVKDGKEKANVLRLEAGTVRDTESDINMDGTLRRRRRGNSSSHRIIR